MDIVFSCPECGNKYRFDAESAGQSTVCGWCSATLLIPAPSGSSPGGAVDPLDAPSDHMWPPSQSGIKRGEGSKINPGAGSQVNRGLPAQKRTEGSGLQRGEGSALRRSGSQPLAPAFASDGDIHAYGPGERPGEQTEALPDFIAASKSKVAASKSKPANKSAINKPVGSTIKGSSAQSKVTRNQSKPGISTIGKRAKPQASQPLLVWAVVGTIIGVTLVSIAVIASSSFIPKITPPNPAVIASSKPVSPKKSAGKVTPGKAATKTVATKTTAATASLGKVVFHWPEADRQDAAVFLGSKKHRIPATGPVEFQVEAGEHDLIIVRRGYDQIEQHVSLTSGGVHQIEPKFAPLWASSLADLRKNDSLRHGPEEAVAVANAPAGATAPPATAGAFDDWEQDLEAAKLSAARDKKNLFILFDGSDWCGYSIRMTETVFAKPQFREQAKKDYVLVFIDFPRSPGAKLKVRDVARNQRTSEHFGIEGYPTIILADEQGRPYGLDGYQRDGVDPFLARLKEWTEVRTERDRLLASIESAVGPAKLSPAAEAVQLLRNMQLLDYYERELNAWNDLAEQHDPRNELGKAELLFEAAWKVRARQLGSRGAQRLVQVAEDLEAWTKQREFKDADRGASLFLAASYWMMTVERPDLAARYADRGSGYKPKKPELIEGLAKMTAAIKSAADENILASGSGFVVAEKGYILTNFHVIDGSEKIMVRFPDAAASVPAKLIAQDTANDIALVKVDEKSIPAAQPIMIIDTQLGRGVEIGAFGYPLNDVVGDGLKLTRGIVSATHNQTRNGMLLLDCRINPGNSGGPLCTSNGCAAGMVTAKSQGGADIESYGMALPGGTILAFLKKHLPDFKPAVAPAASTTGAPAGWSTVDQRVSPSVVLVLKGK